LVTRALRIRRVLQEANQPLALRVIPLAGLHRPRS
jgi:hypothetical protein